jgi:hypothetical protein
VLPGGEPVHVSRRLIGASRYLLMVSEERISATQHLLRRSDGRLRAAVRALSNARARVHWFRNVQQRALVREWLLRHRSSSR